jgi:hypothetical protein
MNEEISPPPSQHEALASLTEIQQVTAQTRQTLAQGMASPILMLWGVVWILGFVITQFFPEQAGVAWMGLDAAGVFGSCWMGTRHRDRVLKREGGGRVLAAWLVLILYMGIWNVLMLPSGTLNGWQAGVRMGAFNVTIPMCGYVIMGLWMGRFFIWLGAGITVLTLVGYYALPHYFFLWTAVTGGGALLGTGWYLRFNWK